MLMRVLRLLFAKQHLWCQWMCHDGAARRMPCFKTLYHNQRQRTWQSNQIGAESSCSCVEVAFNAATIIQVATSAPPFVLCSGCCVWNHKPGSFHIYIAALSYCSNISLQSVRLPSSTLQPENDAMKWPGLYGACSGWPCMGPLITLSMDANSYG